jgi:hypothetical protein
VPHSAKLILRRHGPLKRGAVLQIFQIYRGLTVPVHRERRGSKMMRGSLHPEDKATVKMGGFRGHASWLLNSASKETEAI